MKNIFRLFVFIAPFAIAFLLTGCDAKCWPLCSSSSSGVSSSTTASTTSSTTDPCSDSSATITELQLGGPNGSESFEILFAENSDNMMPIRWTKSGEGAVCIELYKSGEFYYRVADHTDGYKQTSTGMNWKIPDSIAIGSEYQIKLVAPNDSTVSDISEAYFTIGSS